MQLSYLLGLCLLVGGLGQGFAQERNASALLTEPDFIGPVSDAIFSPSVLFSDAPTSVRYVLMIAVAKWDVDAACESSKKALNFFGEEDRLSGEVCQAENTPGELSAYSFLRTVEKEFPEPTRLFSQLMRNNGYDPEDRSTNKTTAIGMANAIGIRLSEWFGKDGWNSLGDQRRGNFGRAFEDYTGYTPMNSPLELKYPLRWQPLEGSDFRVGRYTHQQHVVPFLGQIRPLVLTQEEAAAKQVDMPYMDINATELSENDAHVMDKLMREVFDASKSLTPFQQFYALWWDNKFISVGLFAGNYAEQLQLAPHFSARWLLGEMLAEYDAIILAWREKRRVDAVRPQSIARKFYGDEMFNVFVNAEKGVQSVLGKDWEPFVPTQPHSEFPSGSAALCTAFADHAALLLKEQMDAKGLTEEPPFKLEINRMAAPFTVPDGVDTIEFSTVKEAGRNCGMSRLWAGVHFLPAIPAGEKLVEGVGEKAYLMVKDLSEGRVPQNCWWCTQNS